MTSRRRLRTVVAGTLGFGAVASALIGLAAGNAQIGLHAGFWTMLPFGLWLESRIPE